jgi:hypothetical protein
MYICYLDGRTWLKVATHTSNMAATGLGVGWEGGVNGLTVLLAATNGVKSYSEAYQLVLLQRIRSFEKSASDCGCCLIYMVYGI